MALWFVSNRILHDDLHMPMVEAVIQEINQKHYNKLETHPN